MQVLQYLRYCYTSGCLTPLPCRVVNHCLPCQNWRLREQTLTRKKCHCGSIKGGWWMELPTSLDQPLQGQIVCDCLDMFLPVWDLYLYPERVSLVTSKSQRGTSTLFASSVHEIYNCTKLHTGSAVARVTKDRAARPLLRSTVENQLWRRRQRRQLLTIGQWNVRTLFDREGANRPERRRH